MAFEFYRNPINTVVQLFPFEKFDIFCNIQAVEIWKNALICVVASMDEELVIEECGHVVGTTRDVFAVDFQLRPAGVKGSFVVGFHNQSIVLLIFSFALVHYITDNISASHIIIHIIHNFCRHFCKFVFFRVLGQPFFLVEPFNILGSQGSLMFLEFCCLFCFYFLVFGYYLFPFGSLCLFLGSSEFNIAVSMFESSFDEFEQHSQTDIVSEYFALIEFLD